MTRFPLLIVALLVVVLAAASATATSLLPLSWEQLTQQATRVAWLEAVGRETVQRDDLPWTLVTCRVRANYRGAGTDTVVLAVPGGLRGELTMKVPGAPLPEIGDSFVAFLMPDGQSNAGRSTYRSVGLGQGLFQPVERDGVTYLVQVIGRAPARFAACEDDTATCRAKLGVLIHPLAALATPASGAAE